MADTVVDLGNGSPDFSGMSMNEFMFDQKFPGEVFSGDAPIPLTDFMGRQQTTPGYEAEFLIDPSIETEDITDESKFKRFNPYQDLAEPLVPGVSDPNSALKLIEMGLTRTKPPYQEDNIEAGRPRYENVFSDQGPQIALGEGGNPAVEEAGIMSVDLGMEADKTGPDTMQPIPQYPGIEGFDIYKDLAPPQYPIRPTQSQNFGKKRGFQYGQMVELRDDAVGGKLLKQAGIMMPVDQVKRSVDPKVMDQMSRILGREVV